MTLIVRRMNRFMKRHSNRSAKFDKGNKDQSSSKKRYTSIRCYECDEKVHIASHCHNKKDEKTKSFKKEYNNKKKLFKKLHKNDKGEAHIGEWNSDEEYFDSDDDGSSRKRELARNKD